MNALRPIVAALTLFAFTTILASGAVAAVLQCVESASGCCCAEDEGTERANYAEPGCECPACACTIEESQSPQPWSTPPSVDLTWGRVEAAASPGLANDVAPLDRSETSSKPRGPPSGSAPPLYLLYDTLLI